MCEFQNQIYKSDLEIVFKYDDDDDAFGIRQIFIAMNLGIKRNSNSTFSWKIVCKSKQMNHKNRS